MEDDSERYDGVAGSDELEESELDESDLDDVPLILSDSEPSPGPSTPPSERSERSSRALEPEGSDAGPPLEGAAVLSRAAASLQQQQQQDKAEQRQRPQQPKFALQLPSTGSIGARSRPLQPTAASQGSGTRQTPPARQIPHMPLPRGSDAASCAQNVAGGACARSAKPPPLALFVTSASSPIQSPARGAIRDTRGGSPAKSPREGGARFKKQRPGLQQQQQAAAAAAAQTIQVQLLLPAFDLVVEPPAQQPPNASDTATPQALPDAAVVRDAVARTIGVSAQHLAFFRVQQTDLPLPGSPPGSAASSAPGASSKGRRPSTAGADGSSGDGGGFGARGSSGSGGGSRLASSSSGNGGSPAPAPAARARRFSGSSSLKEGCSSSRGGGCAGSGGSSNMQVVVALTDGSCSFCLADLEDSLTRAEQAAAALKEQQLAQEALQQQLLLKGLEAAERAADCQRLRQGQEQLQHELQRLK